MKNPINLLLFLFISITAFSQIKEGQNFCDATEAGSYFPLEISEKKLFWYNVYYTETKHGTKEINGKTYIEFKQEWKDGSSDLSYFREESGVIYQYEDCCEEDTVRYDSSFNKGHIWKTSDKLGEYEIISYDARLKTPFCEYQNLMIIQARLKSGIYNFYYYKGHGYIGATKDEQLISYVTPSFDLD